MEYESDIVASDSEDEQQKEKRATNRHQASKGVWKVNGHQRGLVTRSHFQETQLNQHTSALTVENKDTRKETAQKQQSDQKFLIQKEIIKLCSNCVKGCVKGRLQKRDLFWEHLGANKYIINMIKTG